VCDRFAAKQVTTQWAIEGEVLDIAIGKDGELRHLPPP
jgi:hypothetical protein